jgi:hypothetical protein
MSDGDVTDVDTGTGFFIAPQQVMTCRHVARR